MLEPWFWFCSLETPSSRACPWCPCYFPPHPSSLSPSLPPPTASAWEITDTESAALTTVLLTGKFLPLRAPGWDQGPSMGLQTWSGRKEGREKRKEGNRWIEREGWRADGRGQGEFGKVKGELQRRKYGVGVVVWALNPSRGGRGT